MGDSGEGEILAMSLATCEEKVSRLIVNVRDGRASPHKICMLLAVLDLARGGGLAENRALRGFQWDRTLAGLRSSLPQKNRIRIR